MLRVLVAAIMLLSMVPGVRSQTVSDTDRQAFARIITEQIEAFRADDGPRAYAHAAPMIKRIFPSPEQFMAMVMKGYQPVYRPQSFRFGESGNDSAGRPIQRVTIVGPDGFTYEAIYTMEQQPDGTWQINGCALVKIADASA